MYAFVFVHFEFSTFRLVAPHHPLGCNRNLTSLSPFCLPSPSGHFTILISVAGRSKSRQLAQASQGVFNASSVAAVANYVLFYFVLQFSHFFFCSFAMLYVEPQRTHTQLAVYQLLLLFCTCSRSRLSSATFIYCFCAVFNYIFIHSQPGEFGQTSKLFQPAYPSIAFMLYDKI